MGKKTLWICVLFSLSKFVELLSLNFSSDQLHKLGFGPWARSFPALMMAFGVILFALYLNRYNEGQRFLVVIPIFYALALLSGLILVLVSPGWLFIVAALLYFTVAGIYVGVCQYYLFYCMQAELKIGRIISISAVVSFGLNYLTQGLKHELTAGVYKGLIASFVLALIVGIVLILNYPLRFTTVLEQTKSLQNKRNLGSEAEHTIRHKEILLTTITVVIIAMLFGMSEALARSNTIELWHLPGGSYLFILLGLLVGSWGSDFQGGRLLPLLSIVAAIMCLPFVVMLVAGGSVGIWNGAVFFAAGIFLVYTMITLIRLAAGAERYYFWVVVSGFIFYTGTALAELLAPGIQVAGQDYLPFFYMFDLIALLVLFSLSGKLIIAPNVPAVPNQFVLAEDAQEHFSEKIGLTSREADVLGLILHGLSTEEIAKSLFLSQSTVKHHIGRILSKAECKNRVELLVYFNKSKENEQEPLAKA